MRSFLLVLWVYSAYSACCECTSLPMRLSSSVCQRIHGLGSEDPCRYRTITFQCSKTVAQAGFCGDPVLNGGFQTCPNGSCVNGYYCNGTDSVTVCRSSYSPVLSFTLSACADADIGQCGQAVRGAGPCLLQNVDLGGGMSITVCGGCASGIIDPAASCTVQDLSSVETDCEGGGVGV